MFLIVSISSSLISNVYANIEFKKYKVINSPKVCGDKLCFEVDERRSKIGLLTREIKVCGDRPCYDIEDKSETLIPKNIETPLGQYKFGIPLDNLVCKNGYDLVLKSSNLKPACISSENVMRLIAIGWAIDKAEQERIISEIPEDKTFPSLESVLPKDFGLSVTPDMIGSQRYLIFEGFGWHRLHNVEVTISSDKEVITSIRSQTSDRGVLYMPWPLPDSISGGLYHVFATDGIHQFEMNIPITHP